MQLVSKSRANPFISNEQPILSSTHISAYPYCTIIIDKGRFSFTSLNILFIFEITYINLYHNQIHNI